MFAATTMAAISVIAAAVMGLQQPSIFKSVAMNSDGTLQLAISSSDTYAYTTSGGWQLASASGLTNQLQIAMSTDGSKYTISGNDGYSFFTGSTYSSSAWTSQGTSSLSGAEVISYCSMDRNPTSVDQILAENEVASVLTSAAEAAFVPHSVTSKCSVTAIGTAYQMAWTADATTIYRSTDYFATSPTEITTVPTGWASSAILTSFAGNLDESALLATSNLGTAMSVDAGATWTIVNSGSSQFCAMSTDGTYMVTLAGPDVQMSFDQGSSWNAAFSTNLSYTPTSVAISEDGSLITMVAGLRIYQATGCTNTGCTSITFVSIRVNPVSYAVEIV